MSSSSSSSSSSLTPPPAPSAADIDDDEWDTEGFVIPSLTVGDSDLINPNALGVADLNTPKANKTEEKIYLGPHGAPPSQGKHQELNLAGRKQRFNHKLKEADRKFGGAACENKVESPRELMGGRINNTNGPKSSSRRLG